MKRILPKRKYVRAQVRLLTLVTVYVCLCVLEQETAQGKTALCVEIDCVMCADFRDLSI